MRDLFDSQEGPLEIYFVVHYYLRSWLSAGEARDTLGRVPATDR